MLFGVDASQDPLFTWEVIGGQFDYRRFGDWLWERFHDWDYILLDDEYTADTAGLTRWAHMVVGQKRRYIQELTKTFLYNYDPLANVDATETRTVSSSGTEGVVSGSKQSTYAFNPGFSTTDVSVPVAKSDGNGTTTRSGSETETLTRKGNIGVTKATDLIRGQRQIIDGDPRWVVIDLFRPYFGMSQEHGGGWC